MEMAYGLFRQRELQVPMWNSHHGHKVVKSRNNRLGSDSIVSEATRQQSNDFKCPELGTKHLRVLGLD